MPEDINELDVNDIGLKMVMGDRFHDETEPANAVNITRKAENPAKKVAKTAEEITRKSCHTVPSNIPEPNWYDRLKECAKISLLFGGLCLLFFYWQQTGQMQPTAALPCMLVCSCLLGLGVGKNAYKEIRK